MISNPENKKGRGTKERKASWASGSKLQGEGARHTCSKKCLKIILKPYFGKEDR